jgi:hypothetical protein
MNGTVYVFNAIPQPVMLTVNNQSGKTAKIPGNLNRPYVPFSTQTTRSDPNQGGLFINGQVNGVSIQYQGGQTTVNVNIPAGADKNNSMDLWLYLFGDRVMLFNTIGDLLEQDLLDWSSELKVIITAQTTDDDFPDEELCG